MRRLLAAAMLAVSALVAPLATPSSALAAPVEAPLAAAPAEAPSNAYLDSLLHEINSRRTKIGSPALMNAGPNPNLAVSRYLADLTPRMQAMNLCFHGNNNPVAPSWDYVTSIGFTGKARGEVLGCPGRDWYWTPQQIADGWWNSPSHFSELYADATANAVACGTYAAGKNGYQTVACVTYKI